MIKTTKILPSNDVNIIRCAAHLRAGQLVAFPTETVYALGAVATDPAAVKRVFEVKGRPADRPLIVAVAKKSDIAGVVRSIPPKAAALIDKFMPGALTLVLDRADSIPDVVTAGGDSVAVRIPDDRVAKKLIELVHKPVVVPSANSSDKPSPTSAEHVRADLDGKVEFILDGGESKIGIESTVIDVRTDPPTVLREGGVSVDDIRAEIGEVVVGRSSSAGAFKPRARVALSAYYTGMSKNICIYYDKLTKGGARTVIFCMDANAKKYGKRKTFAVGKDRAEFAHNLFGLLRRADEQRFDAIIIEGVDASGDGEALVAKLVKLSGGLII